MRKLFAFLIFIGICSAAIASTDAVKNDLEKIFGQKGTVQGDIIKFTFPRSDLKVKMGAVAVKPGLALTSWAGFKVMDDRSIVMGDLVLTNAEVPKVVKKCGEMEIEITALHNHLIGSAPNLMYLHYAGTGDTSKLANAIKSVLAVTKTPIGKAGGKEEEKKSNDLEKLESILGHSGHQKGDLIQFSIERKDKIMENEMEVPGALGISMPINFQMVGKKAATTGDFVLTADEVNPVIKALSENNIQITAVHNHMLRETPRLFFLHFWGYDKPANLAKGIKEALEKVDAK
jgi:Domain of Unknown Function (DUF1259)